MKKYKSVAVVGGGIFGCTAAWMLAKNGFKVELFEKESDIFKSTSSINQYRLHKGYHYPRSKETALSSKNSESDFLNIYSQSVLSNPTKNYYCISKEDSKVSANEYLDFLDQMGLSFIKETPSFVADDNIDLSILSDEKLYNPHILKLLCNQYLTKYRVKVHLNSKIIEGELLNFDHVVNATYSNLNSILEKDSRQEYQFELCEKPVLELPEQYKDQSAVIMDGPFLCIDPLKGSKYHVMGSVEHAIHKTNIGYFPEHYTEFDDLLNNGVISNPHITNIDKFYDIANLFFKDVSKFKHIGSMFTYRAVLPNRDYDDARPTLVNKVGSRTYTMFSGKVGTCVAAAQKLLDLIGRP
jgi:D-amino-acid oxidase